MLVFTNYTLRLEKSSVSFFAQPKSTKILEQYQMEDLVIQGIGQVQYTPRNGICTEPTPAGSAKILPISLNTTI